MIREFSVKTKSSNNKARALFVFCISTSFALVMLSSLLSQYKGVVSLFGVMMFSVGLVMYTKYVAPIYFYDIFIDSDGIPLFVVRQQIGKKYSTLCRIGLNEIIKIDRQLHLKTSSNAKPSGKDCRCYSIHNQTPKMGRTGSAPVL